MKNYLSFLVLLFASHISFAQCTHTFTGIDSWGDGWNGASVEVLVNGVSQGSLAVTGSSGTLDYTASNCDVITFNWTSGNYDNEISWTNSNDAAGAYGVVDGGSGSCSPYCAYVGGTAQNASCGAAQVVLAGINNSSSGSSYTNYSCTVTPGEVSAGSDYTLDLLLNYYSMYVVVGADWNQDGDFSDAGEVTSYGRQQTYNASYTVSVPADAVAGQTRLRIAMSYYEITDVCGSAGSGYGEGEDYAINVSVPVISTTGSLSSFAACSETASSSQQITVSGSSMQAAITATAPTNFEVSSDNVNFGSSVQLGAPGTISESLWVRMANGSQGVYSGDITLSSANASSTSIAVSGTISECSNAVISTSGSLTAFSSCSSSASSSQSFTVSGTDMDAAITVTAPSGFEVSTDDVNYSSTLQIGSAGTINATTIYVRLSASGSGSPSGSLECSSTNTGSQLISASGSYTSAAISLGSVSSMKGCPGSVSSGVSFSVSGSCLAAGVTLTAPSGFEVSSDNSSFSTTAVIGSSGTVSSTAYIRMTSNNSSGVSPNGILTATSSGATDATTTVRGLFTFPPSNTSASSNVNGVCSGETVNLNGSSTTVIYSENFDVEDAHLSYITTTNGEDTEDYQFSALTGCEPWIIVNYDGANSYKPTAGSGNYCAISYLAGCAQDEIWVSPKFTPGSGTSSINVSCDYFFSDWYSGDALYFYLYNHTDNAIAGILYQIADGSENTSGSWDFSFSGNNVATDVYSFRVEYAGNDNDGASFDNVVITKADVDTYAWVADVGGYTSSSLIATSSVLTENTTYTLTATDALGCSSTSTTSVTYDQPAAIATTVDASSVSTGASFRLDQNIGWTSTNSSGIGFIWDADEASPYSNYNWAWTSPATWSDNAGQYLNGGDSRTIYLRARNVNNVTCYSDAVTAVLRKPLVSTSGTLNSFANCEGTAATEQSFTVTGQYLTNDLTVTAPTGFEVSASSGSGYASSITLTPTDGSVSATVYVQIPSTTSSGSPSGDITCASVHNLNGSSTSASATVSAAGTVTAVPTITSSTGATICATGTAVLAATSSAGTINWYTSSTGGSSQGSGTSFTTPSISATTIYYVDATDGSCATGSRTAVTATVNSAPDAGTLTVDLTEALSTQTINWTNSGVSNGTRAYWYQWNDDNTSAPTGTWTDFGASTEAHSWGAGSAGSNMNRTLWVKTIVTTDQGCPGSPAESTPVYTDVINCKAGTTTASVSAGTVANMPFGETITYTSGTPGDGSFERFQYQWDGTSDGSWSDWSTNNPNAYTTDINAGQTLYVRSKIVGAAVNGSATCTDYSNNIQTFLIDCANAVTASAGSDEDLCNGSSVALSGSGSGSNVSSYAWSPNTEISSTTSASPTISATSTRTYTLTNTHDNGCTSTDDVVVTVTDGPSITTATDLTTAANTCGETELTIVHSGTGGGGVWTYAGGLVTYNNSNTTDATINVSPQPSDVNTPITMTWTVNGGEVCAGSTISKTIQFNQPTSVSNPDAYCYLWGGLNSVDITTGSNWYKWDALKSMWAVQSSAPSTSTDKLHVLATDNNCIHATNAVTLGTTTIASLNVGSGASMDLGSGTVTLNGDLTNAGTINEGTGTVSLTAAGDQSFSGGGTTNFNNLLLNKTSDNLVLSSPLTIKGTLTMNKGNINNGSNILTIGESSAIPGAITHSSGSVTGKLRRYFADASSSSKSFPIGNASKTRDVTVNFAASPGSNQFLTASYNAGYPQLNSADLYAGLPLTTSDGQLIQNYDDEGYWEISPGSSATGTGDSYSADINSEDYTLSIHMNGLTGDNAASMDRSKVRIIKSAGPSHTSWVALTHNAATCIGGVDADNNYSVTAAGSGFSFFGAGTDDSNALPVELVSFNGVCNEGVVDLVWQTASEQSSEDFEVAYSRDGVDWKTIHTEPAAGFSNTLLTYDYTHEGVVSGNNYYRLTQNDIDGASVVYDNLILNANCQATSEGYFSVYPNPSSGTFQVIMNNENLKGKANINIVDTKGNVVFTKPIEVNSGINMYVIQRQLSPGIYYINIDNGAMRTQVVKHSIR